MNFAPRTVLAAGETALLVAIEDLDFAGNEYRALHRRSDASAFQEPRWLAALLQDVAPSLGAEPVTVTVRGAIDRRLMLALPLVRRHERGITWLEFADLGLCDYPGAVYDPADAPLLIADPTLPQRLAAALPPHDVLALTKLTGDDPLLERLFPDAWRARMRLSAYPARLESDWTAWRNAKLDQSFRRYLDMKRRRLKRTGKAEFLLLQEPDAIAQAFDALRRYRSDRFKAIGAPDVLDNDAIFAFYRRMAIDGAGDGSARTQALMLAGEPVAVLFGLMQRGVYSLLLVGLDVTRHSRLSPGLLAIEDSLAAAIAGGDRVYDFTIGDHPYKLQFGGAALPLYEWHRARTIRGYAAVAAIAALREAKRILKPLLRREKPPIKDKDAAAA